MNNVTEQNVTNNPSIHTLSGSEHLTGVHKVSALYPSRAEAEGVRTCLLEYGFSPNQIDILHEHSATPTAEHLADGGSDGVLKDVLVDGAIGTAVGTGIGALGTVVMMAANVTLFVAAPIVAPLTMLGWFAGMGGLIGGALGASQKNGSLSDLVTDAIKAGNSLLLVRTRDQAEVDRAKAIINDSLKGRDEVVMESD
ncbi:MAG: hypothetical protein EOO68_22840 [Moraxellaceae bacterium]|nr:MAG: hypothetical protein EOO68_22840 [Moraxellaceae bacterium]